VPDAGEAPTVADRLIAELTSAVGEDGVLTGAAALPFYTDVYRSRETPVAVVRPSTLESLRAAVRIATSVGAAIFPRGGGASYTDGYLPTRPHAVVIDLGRLNRILEINEADGYVTVEAGTTWSAHTVFWTVFRACSDDWRLGIAK
jgi:FAD/FMN-containing dehydrogenase